MPTGVEIVGLGMASVSLGGTAISEAIRFGGKGGAQRAYDGVYNQYQQLKDLRRDIMVHQYLSEDDKRQLDGSIQRITFDLMELQSILNELKGTAYYHLTTYRVQWSHFKDRVGMADQKIVSVKLEVEQRSAQGRSKAMSQNETTIVTSSREPTSQVPHENEPIVVKEGCCEGSSLGQELTDQIASCTAAALRSALAMEDGIDPSPTTNKNARTHTGNGCRSLTETGPSLKWHLPPTATALPPVLFQNNGVELQCVRKDREID
ncbi:unnamed protein product [Rhizoctonia solani]|uniref:Uncharacterized protein n=1 Tax=Rhizoctonia solani TaxID=456999 RepID=A0A8H3CZP5_9AGAM|nr:unnamed protein product [Rhizoctonia solani]